MPPAATVHSMGTGPVQPPGLPPRDFSENYPNYQLAGHQPSTPRWATSVGVALAVLIIMLIVGLAMWL